MKENPRLLYWGDILLKAAPWIFHEGRCVPSSCLSMRILRGNRAFSDPNIWSLNILLGQMCFLSLVTLNKTLCTRFRVLRSYRLIMYNCILTFLSQNNPTQSTKSLSRSQCLCLCICIWICICIRICLCLINCQRGNMFLRQPCSVLLSRWNRKSLTHWLSEWQGQL